MNKIKNVSLMMILLSLAACGGGGGSEPDEIEAPIQASEEPETPVEPDEPETPVEPDPEEPETPTGNTDNSCTDISMLTIAASDDGNFNTYEDSSNNSTDLIPASAIDGIITEESRWGNSTGKALTLDFGTTTTLNNVAILWHEPNENAVIFDIETSTDNSNWVSALSSQTSDTSVATFEIYNFSESTARYLRITGHDESISITEIVPNHCGDINNIPSDVAVHVKPEVSNDAIAHNIELIDWYLNTPEEGRVDDGVSISVRIDEDELETYEDDDYFYPSNDGGLVFRSTNGGARTSSGTSFVRSELREMLRRGDTNISTQGINANNWVFNSATSTQQTNAGGVGGRLTATLSVDYVTTSGDASQVGRVIIGQIHANDDEPIRLYYRKLPGNTKGAIYFAHEPQDENDVYREMIGTRSRSLPDPADGIELGERFSYIIDVTGTDLTVTISRDGKADLVEVYDMSMSGYYPTTNGEEQYMYFKAGVYNQNNSGFDHDYVQATFYEITNTH